MALNAGLGNLGVSAVQFLVPIVIGFNLFGGLMGDAQTACEAQLWVQNAGGLAVLFGATDVEVDAIEDDLTMHGFTVIHRFNKENA